MFIWIEECVYTSWDKETVSKSALIPSLSTYFFILTRTHGGRVCTVAGLSAGVGVFSGHHLEDLAVDTAVHPAGAQSGRHKVAGLRHQPPSSRSALQASPPLPLQNHTSPRQQNSCSRFPSHSDQPSLSQNALQGLTSVPFRSLNPKPFH